MSEKIMTVTGPINPGELGVCLTHEHLTTDGAAMSQEPSDPEGAELYRSEVRAEMGGLLRRNPAAVLSNSVLDDDDELAEELADYHHLGGRSLVEVTPVGMGRDAARLKKLSEATGLYIIGGSAHYVAALQPPWVQEASVEEIAEWFRSEVTEGIDGSGVMPGILGELGISNTLEPSEEKVLRAAAQVHSETDLAISLHVPTHVAAQALDVLEEEGADLTRVVVGHCDVWLDGDRTLDLHRELAQRGCFLAYDTFGGDVRFPPIPLSPVPMWLPGDGLRITSLMALIDSGLAGQLLISQDTCMRMHLLKYGGYGYGEILRTIVPDLLTFGVSQADVDQIMVENPRRLLAY